MELTAAGCGHRRNPHQHWKKGQVSTTFAREFNAVYIGWTHRGPEAVASTCRLVADALLTSFWIDILQKKPQWGRRRMWKQLRWFHFKCVQQSLEQRFTTTDTSSLEALLWLANITAPFWDAAWGQWGGMGGASSSAVCAHFNVLNLLLNSEHWSVDSSTAWASPVVWRSCFWINQSGELAGN